MTELVGADGDLAVTEPVLMEVLAGVRSEERPTTCAGCSPASPLLRLDPVTDFEAAARAYRSCRRAGVTPRGRLDCLTAAVALCRGATLLAQDADLRRVAVLPSTRPTTCGFAFWVNLPRSADVV